VQRQLDRIKADEGDRDFRNHDDDDTALVPKTVIKADEEDDFEVNVDDERLVIPELLYIPQDGYFSAKNFADLPDGHFANASNLVRNRTRFIQRRSFGQPQPSSL
jgi:hypothetical protein